MLNASGFGETPAAEPPDVTDSVWEDELKAVEMFALFVPFVQVASTRYVPLVVELGAAQVVLLVV